MKAIGVVLFALVLLAVAAPVSEGLVCSAPDGAQCSCNCHSHEQECLTCQRFLETYYCGFDFYGGYCDCDADTGGCAFTGICCVWV